MSRYTSVQEGEKKISKEMQLRTFQYLDSLGGGGKGKGKDSLVAGRNYSWIESLNCIGRGPRV